MMWIGITTLNDNIATEVFKNTSVTTSVVSGLALIDQKEQLVGLKVVFCSQVNLEICEGQIVYVKGDSYLQPWAKKVYVVNGVEFILVPKQAILLVEEDMSVPEVPQAPPGV